MGVLPPLDLKEGAVPPGDSIIHNVTSLFSQGEQVNNKYFKHCVANQFFNQNLLYSLFIVMQLRKCKSDYRFD